METDGINYRQQQQHQQSLQYINKPQIKYESQNLTLQPSISYKSQYTQPLTLMDRSNPNTHNQFQNLAGLHYRQLHNPNTRPPINYETLKKKKLALQPFSTQ